MIVIIMITGSEQVAAVRVEDAASKLASNE